MTAALIHTHYRCFNYDHIVIMNVTIVHKPFRPPLKNQIHTKKKQDCHNFAIIDQ